MRVLWISVVGVLVSGCFGGPGYRCDAPDHVEAVESQLQSILDEAMAEGRGSDADGIRLEVALQSVAISESEPEIERTKCETEVQVHMNIPRWLAPVPKLMTVARDGNTLSGSYSVQLSQSQETPIYRTDILTQAMEAVTEGLDEMGAFHPPHQAYRWGGAIEDADFDLAREMTNPMEATTAPDLLAGVVEERLRDMAGDEFSAFRQGLHVSSVSVLDTPYVVFSRGNAQGLGGIAESAVAIDLWHGAVFAAHMNGDDVTVWGDSDTPMPYPLHHWIMARSSAASAQPERALSEDCREIAHAVAHYEAPLRNRWDSDGSLEVAMRDELWDFSIGEPEGMGGSQRPWNLPEEMAHHVIDEVSRGADDLRLVDINNNGTLDWWWSRTEGTLRCTDSLYALMDARPEGRQAIMPAKRARYFTFDEAMGASTPQCGFGVQWHFVENTSVLAMQFSSGGGTRYHLFEGDRASSCTMPDGT